MYLLSEVLIIRALYSVSEKFVVWTLDTSGAAFSFVLFYANIQKPLLWFTMQLFMQISQLGNS